MAKARQPTEGQPAARLNRLVFNDDFINLMGRFHLIWASIDLVTDFAICKFLNLPAEQAHLITSGMMFGRKARLLADLVGRSDHPKKAEILGSFNKLRGNSKRDIFAHSYIHSTANSVTFVERSISGKFTAKSHTFTYKQIFDHVMMVTDEAVEFYNALGTTTEEIDDFANAALSLSRKSNTSPG